MGRKGRRLTSICVFAVVLSSVFVVTAQIALADSYWTDWRYLTVAGWDYKNRAAVTLFDDGTGCTARTTCEWNNPGYSPAWDMYEAKARLFNGAGTVIESKGPIYNQEGVTSISVHTDQHGNNGTRWSKGITWELVSGPADFAQVYTYETERYYYDLW